MFIYPRIFRLPIKQLFSHSWPVVVYNFGQDRHTSQVGIKKMFQNTTAGNIAVLWTALSMLLEHYLKKHTLCIQMWNNQCGCKDLFFEIMVLVWCACKKCKIACSLQDYKKNALIDGWITNWYESASILTNAFVCHVFSTDELRQVVDHAVGQVMHKQL